MEIMNYALPTSCLFWTQNWTVFTLFCSLRTKVSNQSSNIKCYITLTQHQCLFALLDLMQNIKSNKALCVLKGWLQIIGYFKKKVYKVSSNLIRQSRLTGCQNAHLWMKFELFHNDAKFALLDLKFASPAPAIRHVHSHPAVGFWCERSITYD